MIKTLIAFVVAIGLFGGAIYYVNQQAEAPSPATSNNPVVEQPYQGTKRGGIEMRYVGNSVDECSRIRFVCQEGEEYFSDDAGCGCKDIEKKDPVGVEPQTLCYEGYTRQYEANSLQGCNLVDYMCDFAAGEKSFRDETGCGCSIPNTSGEKICVQAGSRYYYGNSPAECKNLSGVVTACDEGQEHFSDETGCGCYTPAGRNTKEYDQDDGQVKNPVDPLVVNLVLGQATTLNRYDNAILPDGSTLTIAEFINEPCPPDVACIWSGQAAYFNYYPKGVPDRIIRMPPYTGEFPYNFELLDTDYETYAKIKLTAKSGGVSSDIKTRKIEEGVAWYMLDDKFTMDDYRNHCSSYYQGYFNGCMSSQCITEIVDGQEVTMCTDDCNAVCVLDQTDQIDQAGPPARVRDISEGIAWYYQDPYVTGAIMENHCIETYQGTFDSCATPPSCATGNCAAVCLPGCFIPN